MLEFSLPFPGILRNSQVWCEAAQSEGARSFLQEALKISYFSDDLPPTLFSFDIYKLLFLIIIIWSWKESRIDFSLF